MSFSEEEIKKFSSDNYYEVLGIEKNATNEEIRHAYTNLALKYHPDKHIEPNKREIAEKIFVHISTAYSILYDSKRRAIYDQVGKAGLDGVEGGELTAQQAVEIFGQIFDKLFVYGYNKEEEKPEEPSSKHGLKQAVKGALQAPLVGAGTGAAALAGGLLVGGAHVIGGVGEGVGNFLGGIKEIGKAAVTTSNKPEVVINKDNVEVLVEPPDWKNGLKRATVGLALPPLKGISKGVQSVVLGAGSAGAMLVAGTYGAYVNIKQGRAEISAAEQLERESGIPENVQRGESLKRKNFLLQLEKEKKLLEREPGEEIVYFRCITKAYVAVDSSSSSGHRGSSSSSGKSEENKNGSSSTSSSSEKEGGGEEGGGKLITKNSSSSSEITDETKNCIFLTNSRLIKIENNKIVHIVYTSDILDCCLVNKSFGSDCIELTLKKEHNNNVNISSNNNKNNATSINKKIVIEIPEARVCAFFAWKLQAQRSKIPCPVSLITQGQEALFPFIAQLDSKCIGWTGVSKETTEWDPEKETVLYHYCNEYSRDLAMDSVTHCVVATSRRIVLVEDAKVKADIPYTDVTAVRHEERGLLAWDRLIILSAGPPARSWTIPISRNKAAVFFAALVQQLAGETAAAREYLTVSHRQIAQAYVEQNEPPPAYEESETKRGNEDDLD